MLHATRYEPAFDRYSLGRIARQLFNFPTDTKDAYALYLNPEFPERDCDPHGSKGFYDTQRETLKMLIEEMEDTSQPLTLWQTYRRMDTFQKQWEASHPAETDNDRFSNYAANRLLPYNTTWPLNTHKCLNLFESHPNLDKFLEEKNSSRDFLSDFLSTYFQTELKKFNPNMEDEKALKSLFIALDQELKNELETFWDSVLKKVNNKPLELRIALIQDKLCFACRERAIMSIMRHKQLEPDDKRVKWHRSKHAGVNSAKDLWFQDFGLQK